jgi:hypothetical protein
VLGPILKKGVFHMGENGNVTLKKASSGPIMAMEAFL